MEILFKPNWAIRQQQMGDCVQTFGHLMGWLRREDSPPEGSLNTCIEATLIHTLNRLDKILTDDALWAIPADRDAHGFGAESAALQNALVHSELQARTIHRQEHSERFAQLAAMLSARREEEKTPKQRRQQKKSQ